MHLVSLRKYILLCFNSYYYGCGVRSPTGYIRILIPDKEWDLLVAHFGFEKESLKELNEYLAIDTGGNVTE